MLCSIQDVCEGMRTAAAVFHPRRPEMELLAVDVPLDRKLLDKLPALGVTRVWVEHDATSDLNNLILARPSEALNNAFNTLKEDFSAMSAQTVTAGSLQTYRQIIMELMCELVANRDVACLTEQLIGGPAKLFTHSANVAYLSVLVGIDLETYIVQQRSRLGTGHARDITALGMGAMMHDMGKVVLDKEVESVHELDTLSDGMTDGEREAYQEHVITGYMMLRGTRAPASASQVVLTHHQHWDGGGFPDMSGPTHNRLRGVQQGQNIHIFSRIVAASNLLENLRASMGPDNPPVMALHALQDGRFDGWLDPIVRDSVLRRIPPFPVGGAVTLSDGRPAVVITPSLVQPCRPTVRLLAEADRLPDGRHPHLDLREHPDLHIAAFAGQPIERYLFTLVEDLPLSTKIVIDSSRPDGRKNSA
jgi:HD-GYP domain-containing protein (c-di-GMP phosphodiesterase class II)